MTAFAGVPCVKCGEARDSDQHKPLSESPRVLAGLECREPEAHHAYDPDRRSLEAVAVELLAALDDCAADLHDAATIIEQETSGNFPSTVEACHDAYARAKALVARARAIGIKPPTDEAAT